MLQYDEHCVHQLFTVSERTVRKYPVSLAVNQAKMKLAESKIYTLCINTLYNYCLDYGDLLTMCQISKLVEELVDDTMYHESFY